MGHLKSIVAPKTWPIKRKGKKWLTRPNPGSTSLKFGLSLNEIFKNQLKLANTTTEVRKILQNKEVFVDGKIQTNQKYFVGLMSVISIPKLEKYYRMLFSSNGKLTLVETNEKEASFKLSRIFNKTMVKGRLQLNLNDGRNILVDKNEYNTGDSLQLELPSSKIKDGLKFETGAYIFIVEGKHAGKKGKLESIEGNTIFFKSDKTKNTVETLKKYAFVIGKDKPIITI